MPSGEEQGTVLRHRGEPLIHSINHFSSTGRKAVIINQDHCAFKKRREDWNRTMWPTTTWRRGCYLIKRPDVTGNMIRRHKEGKVEMVLSDRAVSSRIMLRESLSELYLSPVVIITVYCFTIFEHWLFMTFQSFEYWLFKNNFFFCILELYNKTAPLSKHHIGIK